MKQRVWGVRLGHSHEIVAQIISYLQSHPANYCEQMDTLLELIYQAYTEFNSVETLEFKAIVNPLDQTLRSLVDTDAGSFSVPRSGIPTASTGAPSGSVTPSLKAGASVPHRICMNSGYRSCFRRHLGN